MPYEQVSDVPLAVAETQVSSQHLILTSQVIDLLLHIDPMVIWSTRLPLDVEASISPLFPAFDGLHAALERIGCESVILFLIQCLVELVELLVCLSQPQSQIMRFRIGCAWHILLLHSLKFLNKFVLGNLQSSICFDKCVILSDGFTILSSESACLQSGCRIR